MRFHSFSTRWIWWKRIPVKCRGLQSNHGSVDRADFHGLWKIRSCCSSQSWARKQSMILDSRCSSPHFLCILFSTPTNERFIDVLWFPLFQYSFAYYFSSCKWILDLWLGFCFVYTLLSLDSVQNTVMNKSIYQPMYTYKCKVTKHCSIFCSFGPFQTVQTIFTTICLFGKSFVHTDLSIPDSLNLNYVIVCFCAPWYLSSNLIRKQSTW